MIELKNIEFQYHSKSPLLLFPEIKIKKGEKVFLFGPSGSGKTTLLGLISGVLKPISGEMILNGQNFLSLSSSEKDTFRGNHIGYIFQQFNLIPYLTAYENILLSVELNPKRGKKEASIDIHKHALELSHSLGITSFLNQNVTELSVGQQQRVAAARALLGAPEILIADEPTSALDYDHREAFLKCLFDECSKRNTTLLFVSHDRPLEKSFDRSLSLLDLVQRKDLK